MKVCCVADLHGHLPEVPDCDLLLIGGDIVPLSVQASVGASGRWLGTTFARWLSGLAVRGIRAVGVAGNHDLVFERAPLLVPDDLPWTYLRDGEVTLDGLRIWGAPWQPTFGTGWAFNLDEPALSEKWALIPEGIDVLVVHGPPRGVGDYSTYSRDHVGSASLRDRILALGPALVVTGHIHSGYGRHLLGPTAVVNAAHCDDQYRPVNPPLVVEVEAPEARTPPCPNS